MKQHRLFKSIIEEVGIKVNSIENLVFVQTKVHRRVHTTFYHQWVERTLIRAYNAALGDKELQRKNVIDALGNIGRLIRETSF